MNKKIVKQFFPEAVKKYEEGICPCCNKKVCLEDFKDNLSLKEFEISGLCHKCQDNVFGEK